MQIGVDLGGSHVGVGIVSENGKIVVKKEQDLIIKDKNEQEIKQYIEDVIIYNISDVLRTVGSPMCLIEKIGIASPGKVRDNVIKEIFNLNIKEFALAKDLEEHYGVPVVARNDAKCAGIAEKEYGALKDYSDAVFLCLGTGIGGATFYNGNLVEPKRSEGSEYGHMIINKNGNLCKCGNKGCFETYCSMKAFKTSVIESFNLNENVESKELLQFVLDNLENDKMNEIIDNYIDNLVLGISNIVNIIEPEVICLGGGFIHFKEVFYSKLLNKMDEAQYRFDVPKVVLGKLDNDAGMIGAVCWYK